MGLRGPKSKPTSQQKLDGTYRADRRRGEPQPEQGQPKVPPWLDQESRKHWKKIAPVLDECNLLTHLDATALALLCRALADYLESCAIIEKAAEDGGVKFVAYTDKGNIIQHPAVGVKNRAWDQVVKLLREFGMTPSARAAIHIQPAEGKEDDLIALIRERYGSKTK